MRTRPAAHEASNCKVRQHTHLASMMLNALFGSNRSLSVAELLLRKRRFESAHRSGSFHLAIVCVRFENKTGLFWNGD
jgi:hypothetical protein